MHAAKKCVCVCVRACVRAGGERERESSDLKLSAQLMMGSPK